MVDEELAAKDRLIAALQERLAAEEATRASEIARLEALLSAAASRRSHAVTYFHSMSHA